MAIARHSHIFEWAHLWSILARSTPSAISQRLQLKRREPNVSAQRQNHQALFVFELMDKSCSLLKLYVRAGL